jgi:hypothetical protein
MDNCCVRSIKGNKNRKIRKEQNSRKQKEVTKFKKIDTSTRAAGIKIEYNFMGLTRRNTRNFCRNHKNKDTRPSKQYISSETLPNPRQPQNPKIHKLRTMIS